MVTIKDETMSPNAVDLMFNILPSYFSGLLHECM